MDGNVFSGLQIHTKLAFLTMVELARRLEDAPRHLGVHSGGMVICDRPVIEVSG